jgi:hypothetical protein
VDGRKSLEGEDLSGLSVGAKCVSEGRNGFYLWLGWDGMMGLMELGLMNEEEGLRWEWERMDGMECLGWRLLRLLALQTQSSWS